MRVLHSKGGATHGAKTVTDALKSSAFNGTTFATTPSATGSVGSQIWPGGILTLSANADTPGTGVVWATVAASGDAENNPPCQARSMLSMPEMSRLSSGIRASMRRATLSATSRSSCPHLVANGGVYVAAWSKQVAVYELLAPAPILTMVSPISGPTAGNTAVTLTGQSFASGATVTFGGAAATSVTVVSATPVTARTPPHAQGGVNVVVTKPDGQSGMLASGFTYHKH